MTTTTTNGTLDTTKTRKPRVKKTAETTPTTPKSRVPSVATQRKWITLAMGCGIPVLSFLLSSAGGHLVADGRTWVYYALGFMAFGLCSCALAVSLTHLADAIGDITRSSRRASWLLAVAFDSALIFGELVRSLASEADVGWTVGAIMMMVVVFSMGLNCWAFFRCHATVPGTTHTAK